MARANPHFTCVPVWTDKSSDAWKGGHGRINAAMIRKYVPNLTQPIFYLAGPEGMVKAKRQLLVDMKVNEDNIRAKAFAGYWVDRRVDSGVS